MIMIQQQQVYPHFVGQAMSSPNSSTSIREETSMSSSSSTSSSSTAIAVTTPTSAPVCVIKETESVRNLSLNGNSERHRSVSPTIIIRKPIKRESIASTSPPLSISRSETLSPQPVTTQLLHKSDIRRIIKRSNSVDDELYDAEEQIIKHAEEQRRYDSDPEGHDNDHDRLYDYSTRGLYINDNDDEDGPLDLSTGGRRRHQSYSDTESGDSAGTSDENADVGKAAYKKNLMKRYCK